MQTSYTFDFCIWSSSVYDDKTKALRSWSFWPVDLQNVYLISLVKTRLRSSPFKLLVSLNFQEPLGMASCSMFAKWVWVWSQDGLFLAFFRGKPWWSSTPYATGESGFLLFPQKKKKKLWYLFCGLSLWNSELVKLSLQVSGLKEGASLIGHAIFKVSPTYHLSIQPGFIVFPSWLGEAFMDSC